MAILAGMLFAVGSIGSALSPSIGFLIASRFLLGLSADGSTRIIPVYIAEVSPPAHRGKMVVLFQFMVVFGITVAYPPASPWAITGAGCSGSTYCRR